MRARWRAGARPWLFGALAVQAAVWWAFLDGRRVFPLDDAYIHLAYVRCLVQTGTFCLNPGEPSLGTSSPLWVMLLAGPYRLGLDPYWTVQLAALAFSLGTTALGFDLARRAAERLSGVGAREARLVGLAAALLLAWNGDLHWLAQSGMETAMLLFLGLLAVRLYVVRGFDPVVGFVSGLAVMTRAPAVALPAVLVLCDLAQGRRWSWWRGGIAAGLTYLPFAVVSLRITGGIVPTTAKGKLLTFVRGGLDAGEMLHYAGRFLEFQRYVWANVALLGVVIVASGLWLARAIRARRAWTDPVVRSPECAVLLAWGALHFLLYALTFRTLGQEGRYMAEENVVLAVTGPVFLAYLVRSAEARPRLLRTGLGALLVLAVATLPSWRRIYAGTVAQVAESFVPMARWIAAHTPADARVAAFDIGALRYLGDRYTIDLGGLVDPRSYPCLRAHDCAGYARDQGATYFLYSKDPEADFLTGIYKAERAGVLKQSPVATFAAQDRDAPTMNHSVRLELDRVDGWFAPNDPEARFIEAPASPGALDGPRSIAEGIVLVDAAVDVREVRYLLHFPYFLSVTFAYRAESSPASTLWAHVAFFDAEGRILEAFHEAAALPAPGAWRPAQTVRDRHQFMLRYDRPEEAPGPSAVLRVAFTEAEAFDAANPGRYAWTTIASVPVISSAMRRPLAPL